HAPRWMAAFVVVIGLCGLLFWRLPSSFLPNEDQGTLMVMVQLPPGATIDRTSAVMTELSTILQGNPAIAGVMEVGGFSFVGRGENAGMAFVTLAPWSQRDENAEQIIAWINQQARGIKQARVCAANSPVIRGLGQFGGFDFRLEDPAGQGHATLMQARDQLIALAAKDPLLHNVRSNGLDDAPQLGLKVDRVKAQAMGVDVSDVFSAIQLMLAPVYANDFIHQGRILRVQLQADAPWRMNADSLQHYYVRSDSGNLVPVASLVSDSWGMGSPTLDRYNGFAATALTGSPAPGHSSGEAMAAMQKLMQQLPAGFSYEWSGQSLQEILSGEQAPIIFALSLLVVFLCLAALYESWSVPLSVLMVVPLGLLGALLFTWLRGLSDDIYFKVGLIAIIGLAAKNAILIIEFARAEQEQHGKGAIAAILEACRLRFRPVLMTSIAFIFGVLPLALSTGAGANSRHAIGTGVAGGMLVATILGVLMIPVFYVVVRRLIGDRSDGTEAKG
ncbi:MAG TPA: efflux RND transporter permease subunit, partial [Rhodanobacteraceae bacterium]|nr:efflux RND transporter permease subunit [Rhodanobacteraceae bacterium]